MQWSLQLDKLKSVNKSTKYCILRKVNWNNQNNPLQLFRCRKHTPCCGFLIISVNRSYLKLSKASLDCCFPRYWYILLWRRDSMSCWYSTCRLEDIQHVGIWEWETMKWWKKAWMLELITANIVVCAQTGRNNQAFWSRHLHVDAPGRKKFLGCLKNRHSI